MLGILPGYLDGTREWPVGRSAPSGDAVEAAVASGAGVQPLTPAWSETLSPAVLAVVAILLLCSAFFSSSETALFSLHKLRVRSMREEEDVSGKLVAGMLDSPGRILTTILVGNMIVNVLIGVVLGTRVELALERAGMDPPALAYVVAVLLTTAVLVVFGEILPKVFAVGAAEPLARAVAVPLTVIDKAFTPLRDALLGITDLVLRLARFHEVRAAPFITDEELRAVLTHGETRGVIEEEERQMIQGILEFSDAMLREILVPRPDVVAVPATATLREALEVLRESQYSRMPVYEDDLDHIVGLLVGKDMLPYVARGDLDRPVKSIMRPIHFVPETMTVQAFVKDAQRHRAHLAVVVDEYGGTAGTVTLEDAMEEVVGDIMDEGEREEPEYERVGEGEYRVDGGFGLDELSELIHVKLEDNSHETVAGFLMNQTEKIPEVGDRFEHAGVLFTVETVDGKRASSVRVQILQRPEVQEIA